MFGIFIAVLKKKKKKMLSFIAVTVIYTDFRLCETLAGPPNTES